MLWLSKNSNKLLSDVVCVVIGRDSYVTSVFLVVVRSFTEPVPCVWPVYILPLTVHTRRHAVASTLPTRHK